ncbi:MAG: arylesterase [Enterovirga sp.]|jgi:acyl-CoA thioesterase-1|nr:arylesterase [Enterovirga sp.]
MAHETRSRTYGPPCGFSKRQVLRAALVAVASPLVSGGFASAAPGGVVKLVALGDSLTAGYNLPQNAAFPSVLEAALKARGHKVEIANAGVSGDTATGGLERVDWSVPDGTDGVILELGANDMLRGTDPDVTRRALDTIIARLTERKIPVMLAGMYAARNLGPDYIRRFDAIYPELAQKHGLVLYPFFLDGVAGEAKLTLPDGLHPSAEGVKLIVERILPAVETFLARLTA